MGLVKFFGLNGTPKKILWWHDRLEMPKKDRQILLYYDSGFYGNWFGYKIMTWGEWASVINGYEPTGQVVKWAYLN